MYRFLRSILFLLPAETAHYVSMNLLRFFCSFAPFRKIMTDRFSPGSKRIHELNREVCGLNFKNPVGLGAGFDKNARYLRELEALGFGFVEIGTVTPLPQEGNARPRLFRLPEDKALINRMGFNNEGLHVIASRLKQWKEDHSPTSGKQARMLIGGNIGKNKITPNEDAWKDYDACFKALHSYVDFFVVNVSSPNTPGLRELQEKDALKIILQHLQQLNNSFAVQKPVLLKIAPDLTDTQVDDVIELALEINLDGLVVSNTTISREGLESNAEKVQQIGAGGLSGRPLQNRSTSLIRYIRNKTGGRLPIIGSGGIFSGKDAIEKLDSGASLIEVWTGFIYEGPFIVKRICKALLNR